MLLTGILPFGAIFVELYFIMNSLWSAKIYYMFGFLFVCYGLMVVTCATVTVLSIYFVLCSENYHWQWRAFFTSGSCAIYVFANAIFFWASRLSFGSLTSAVLYLGYSALISLMIFILTGTIGFVASWFFVHRIYRSIKVD
jgi:transmembrane 9 superfamily protein 2/4